MCRAGGRRCPSHADPTAVAERNKRRREQYAASVGRTPQQTTEQATVTSTITAQQTEYFKDSKAAKDGNLITLYHGSSHEFTSFNPETLGKGNDSWGNGFYFTDQQHVAEGYAADSKSETANVKNFYLNLTNPMYADGKENMSLNHVTFTSKQAAAILRQHPDAYIQPDDEEGNMSFLGDYSETYWDKTTHTQAEIEKMIDEVAKQHFSNASWTELESLFGKDHGSAFLHAMHKETGHDGLIVDFGEDGKHYVAWFPEQMKLTTNGNPTNNNEF